MNSVGNPAVLIMRILTGPRRHSDVAIELNFIHVTKPFLREISNAVLTLFRKMMDEKLKYNDNPEYNWDLMVWIAG